MAISTWVVLIGGLLSAVAGADFSGHERLQFLSEPKWKRAKAPTLLLALVLVFLGGVLSEREKAIAEADRTKAEEQLRKEIAAIKDTQTGGNSFCYVAPSLGEGTSDSIPLMLVQQGDFPVYNIQVLIHDLERPDPTSMEDLLAHTVNFQIPELGQTALMLNPRWTLSSTGKQDYTVQVGARNGWLTQAIRMRRVGGRWVWHTVVFRDRPLGKREVLLRKTDPGFPADAAVRE